jgi:hypothetical protein
LTFKDFQAARNWQELANNVTDMELFTACQAEAKESPINPSAVDQVKIKSDGSLDKLKWQN